MNQTDFPGDELRERREELGLSTADVYRKTRIPISYLVAMERGAVTELPPMCYAAGFVRTYCRFLKLDPERFCDCLRACTQPPPGRFLRRTSSSPAWTWPSWLNETLTWAAVCAGFLLAWFTYSAVLRPNADATDSHVEAGTTEMVLPPPPAELDF